MPIPQNLVKNACDIEHGDWGLVPYAGNEQNVRLGSGSSQTSQSCSSGDICRICHCESDTLNPLLAPCYCSGSLKYVHQTCLQQWLTASETRSCELCKFPFIMHTKIKPFNEWRRLEMSGVERRRLCCAVLFHCVAALCVIWSLFVLIDRAAEEVQRGLIAWPFWTKLVVVAVGFTGGAVFMYIQCRQYLQLCNRWRSHNRILLIQNAPEKVHIMQPSPVLGKNQNAGVPTRPMASQRFILGQVVANIENDPLNLGALQNNGGSNNDAESELGDNDISHERSHTRLYNIDSNSTTSVFLENQDILGGSRLQGCDHRHSVVFLDKKSTNGTSANRRYSDTKLLQNFNVTNYLGAGLTEEPSSSSDNPNLDIGNGKIVIEKTPEVEVIKEIRNDTSLCPSSNADILELTIKQILDLDMKSNQNMRSVLSLNHKGKGSYDKSNVVFKSLPNLSASSENLLP